MLQNSNVRWPEKYMAGAEVSELDCKSSLFCRRWQLTDEWWLNVDGTETPHGCMDGRLPGTAPADRSSYPRISSQQKIWRNSLSGIDYFWPDEVSHQWGRSPFIAHSFFEGHCNLGAAPGVSPTKDVRLRESERALQEIGESILIRGCDGTQDTYPYDSRKLFA